MKNQISAICKSSWYYICQLRRIRKLLNPEQAKILVHAFIVSRIDGCNALLFGLPDKSLQPLQRVQNAAARLICDARKFDRVTPLLRSLHWLPVAQRIEFKILLLTFKCFNDCTPVYLSELVAPYIPVRALRSGSDGRLLVKPASRLKTCGDRAFSVAAPTLWNKLPLSVRSITSVSVFKRAIKTRLFTECFN